MEHQLELQRLRDDHCRELDARRDQTAAELARLQTRVIALEKSVFPHEDIVDVVVKRPTPAMLEAFSTKP